MYCRPPASRRPSIESQVCHPIACLRSRKTLEGVQRQPALHGAYPGRQAASALLSPSVASVQRLRNLLQIHCCRSGSQPLERPVCISHLTDLRTSPRLLAATMRRAARFRHMACRSQLDAQATNPVVSIPLPTTQTWPEFEPSSGWFWLVTRRPSSPIHARPHQLPIDLIPRNEIVQSLYHRSCL